MTIYFDCETTPCTDPAIIANLRADADSELEEALDAVKCPSNYKYPEKIANYVVDARNKLIAEHAANIEASILKTSLDGGLGQLCVIGWAIDDAEPRTLTSALGEATLLDTFFAKIAPHEGLIVGHNVIEFDLPFIWKRAVILGVQPPDWLPRQAAPWDTDRVFDTMLRWAGRRGYITLHRLCRLLGIDSDDMVTGADVWPLVQAGKIAEVQAHCVDDIRRVREVHKRMTFVAPATAPLYDPNWKAG